MGERQLVATWKGSVTLRREETRRIVLLCRLTLDEDDLEDCLSKVKCRTRAYALLRAAKAARLWGNMPGGNPDLTATGCFWLSQQGNRQDKAVYSPSLLGRADRVSR